MRTSRRGREGSDRSLTHQGAVAEVAVDVGALHLFDPATGAGIYANDSKRS